MTTATNILVYICNTQIHAITPHYTLITSVLGYKALGPGTNTAYAQRPSSQRSLELRELCLMLGVDQGNCLKTMFLFTIILPVPAQVPT